MSSGDAYERAGVSQRAADAAVAALLESLRRIDPGRPSRQALAAGHYASVIWLDETVWNRARPTVSGRSSWWRSSSVAGTLSGSTASR